MPATEFYLRSYPLPDDVRAHAAAAEDDGWDGLLLTDTQTSAWTSSGRSTWPPRPRRD